MFNKKNNGLKVTAIVAGTVAGVAAIAAGAVWLYKRYIANVTICCSCEECSCSDECDCHGEHLEECFESGKCVATEKTEEEQLKIEDLEPVEGTAES